MDLKSKIQENITQVKSQIKGANLLAVSKYSGPLEVEAAYEAGQRDFGENRVYDLVQKSQSLKHLKDLRWHFIGQLQSNKISKLLSVSGLYAIHSIDRLEIAKKLVEKKIPHSLNYFVQVNTGGESQKSGVTELDEVQEIIKALEKNSMFKLKGLMTMSPIRVESFEEGARNSFSKLRSFKESLLSSYPELELSMGMSSDYDIALEYGANWLRIGSKIFKT